MLTNHLFPPQPFQIHVTLFSKFFSHFPHGTCFLSAPNQCSPLDELYHQLCIPDPRNATLQHTPNMGQERSILRNFTFSVVLLQETSARTSISSVLPFCRAWICIKQTTCAWHCSFARLLNTHFKFTFLHLLICLNSVGQTDWQHEHGLHSAPAPHTNCSMSVQGVCWVTLFICGSNGITTSLLINIHMLSDNTADLPIAKSKDTFPIQSPEDSRHSASCFGKGSLLHPSSMAGLIYSQLKAFTAPRTILE